VAAAAVAALAGAVLAVAVLDLLRDLHRPVVAAGLVGVVVLLGAAVGTMLGSAGEPPRQGRPAGPVPPGGSAPGEPERPWSWAGTGSGTGSGGRRAPVAAPERERPAPQWWSDRAAGPVPAAAPLAPAGPLVPALQLPEQPPGTRIVQCPRCGDGRVDLRHSADGFAFRCGACGHHWTWQAGAPWPVTVVRPGLRRAAAR